MSRTHRRKGYKNPRVEYKSEAEFEFLKALHESGNPSPRTLPTWAGTHQWRDYWAAMYFRKRTWDRSTYKAFVKMEKAKFHSDNGYGHHWAQRAPGDVERLLFQKPLRMQTRLAIKAGLKHDSWDELIFPVHIGTSGTWWLWD